MSNRIVTGIAGLVLAAFALGCDENTGPAADTSVAPLTLSPASIGIDHGATGVLVPVGPDNTTPSVTWESANTAIATVNAAGVVTAVSPGVTAVTARLASDATVLRSATVTVVALTGTLVQSGVPVTNLSAATNAEPVYRIFVPAGSTQLVVAISGGTGDADLYVRRGAVPTITTGTSNGLWDCRPYRAGNNETCTIPNPASGTWYIKLHAYEAFAGMTLTATRTP